MDQPRLTPFDEPSALPFAAPPFDRIEDADFPPALAEGLRQARAEAERIAVDDAAPTFENTVLALEESGRMLERASSVFFALTSAHTNATLEEIESDVAPKLSELHDAIYLDSRLFERVKAVREGAGRGINSAEALRLTEITFNRFVRAGAGLPDSDKAKLSAINSRLASLSTSFQHKLLAATKAGALLVDDESRLAGLTEPQLAAAAASAHARGEDGKWLLVLHNTTQQPILTFLENRETRRELFERAWARSENGDSGDTRATLLEIVALRAEKAALLGHDDYAGLALADQMAQTPAAVEAFLAKLIGPIRDRAAREACDIGEQIRGDGGDFELEPWDWDRYAEAVRKTRYDFDEIEVRNYFELNAVLHDGAFHVAEQLYGVTFRPRSDIPVYHADVRVFEALDEAGGPIGLIYFDFFQRDSKLGGAWMGNFVEQSHRFGQRPVVYNVCNFTKPAAGQPALLGFDDVVTLFHEFGHALHGLLADGEFASLSGTNVARDFVELPSQFNEHWARDPGVLARYARHWRTGAPMPAELVEKVQNAALFNKGYDMGELTAAACLDMSWHRIGRGGAPADVLAFETEALAQAGAAFPHVPPRYRSSYFQHIFGGGYAAGYYAYLWTQMLADQAFAWCRANGGLTRENGERFRDLVLARGRTRDYGEMFRAFCGADPDIGPMLAARGLA